MTLIDTNVLVDVRERDARWGNWSFRALADARLTGEVVASSVSVGELASRSGTLQDILAFCRRLALRIVPLSSEGAFLAGRAQRAYRAAGGRRERLLADFLIGGEALGIEAGLLTRDRRHYTTYFPELTIITPETGDG